jgi:hypothetical protein
MGVWNGNQVFSDRHLKNPRHGMATKEFWSPKRAWGDEVFSKLILHAPPPFLAIEKFQSPSNIPHHQMTTKRGGAYVIFFREIFFPVPSVLEPKNFGRHPMMWVSWMVTGILQLSFDNGVMSNYNQSFFITIRYTPIVQW